MSANKRLFYAVKQVGVAANGTNTFTSVHGLQSVGVNTKFDLEQVFEIGQLAIYANLENIPDIEVTMEKCLDGYPLLWHLCTYPSTSPTLVGRSNQKVTVGLSVYPDTQNSASGTPLHQATMSGMFVSQVSYDIAVQGPLKESVTLVGQNKVWNNTFTATAFNNADAPSGSGIMRRQHVVFGSGAGHCLLPLDIPGVDATGYVLPDPADTASWLVAVQSFKVSANLGREQLFELGRKGVYHRYVSFPVEVRTDIEIMAKDGDLVQALEEADNLTERAIRINLVDGTVIDLSTHNKLTSANFGGGNAGQNGGNDTITFSYITYNDLTVSHPADPSGL